MHWYQLFAIGMLTLSALVALFNSKSCTGMIIHLALVGLWVWALNAGNFFA